MYDKDNVFAKIIRGEIPSYKIYEDELVLAILDAYPVVQGHTLVMPKAMGYCSLFELPDDVSAHLGMVLPRICRAVKQATECDAVNVIQNVGRGSGQLIFHPHWHIIPRIAGDGLIHHPKSATSAISKEVAAPLVEAISRAFLVA